jgi:hypothetical protein
MCRDDLRSLEEPSSKARGSRQSFTHLTFYCSSWNSRAKILDSISLTNLLGNHVSVNQLYHWHHRIIPRQSRPPSVEPARGRPLSCIPNPRLTYHEHVPNTHIHASVTLLARGAHCAFSAVEPNNLDWHQDLRSDHWMVYLRKTRRRCSIGPSSVFATLVGDSVLL